MKDPLFVTRRDRVHTVCRSCLSEINFTIKNYLLPRHTETSITPDSFGLNVVNRGLFVCLFFNTVQPQEIVGDTLYKHWEKKTLFLPWIAAEKSAFVLFIVWVKIMK